MKYRNSFCVVFLLLIPFTSVGQAADVTNSIRAGDSVVSISHPDDWKFETQTPSSGFPVTVALTPENGALKIQISLIPIPVNEDPLTQVQVQKMLESVGQGMLSQSVEKVTRVVDLKPTVGTGFYTSFTDAKLVQQEATSEGEFKKIAPVMIGIDRLLINATILSNAMTTKDAVRAFEILRSGLAVDNAASQLAPKATAWDDPFIVSVPGESWQIKLPLPSMVQFTGQSDDGRFRLMGKCQGNVNVSVFVESPPAGQARTQQACHKYYWGKASQNPMVDAASVKVINHPAAVEVSYNLTIPGQNVRMPHRNYYFAFGDKWIDIHLSVFPVTDGAEEKAATFASGITFSKLE